MHTVRFSIPNSHDPCWKLMAQILAVRSSDTALNLGLNLSQVCHSGPTPAQLPWMIDYSPTGNPDVRRPLSFWWTTMNMIPKASYFHIPFTEKKGLFLRERARNKKYCLDKNWTISVEKDAVLVPVSELRLLLVLGPITGTKRFAGLKIIVAS
jgi:hypothetical protein